MPLYDVSYRRFEGTRVRGLARIWALARFQMLSLLKQRRFLFLMFASWIPAFVRGGQIYVAKQFPQAAPFLEVDQSLWRDFLSQQVSFLLVILVALYAGSGSIASDLRSGALVIYLSKPLSRMDYLVGKCLPLVSAILAVTVLPGFALLLFQLGLSENWSLLSESPWLPASILAYSLWLALYFCLMVLTVSSLSRSRRLAAVGFVLLVLGSHALYGMAMRMSFGNAPAYLSLIGASVDVADLFFGLATENGSSWGSLVVMTLLMVAGIGIIDRRLRSSEVAT